ncbi:hypothetical protein [Polaromonas sp. UC242_47]|uniref:hypothetical protein n=1 Tax=Polaromonas sp. UC242_47 TaxID=3374626 RepID=UPI0037B5A2BA
MSSSVLRIEIETSDTALLRDLQAQNIEGLRLMRRAFTCDSAEWIPPVEKVLSFIVEASVTIDVNLVAAWLYDRFKEKPPEKVIVNGTDVEPERVTIVINNYAQNIQVNNFNNH